MQTWYSIFTATQVVHTVVLSPFEWRIHIHHDYMYDTTDSSNNNALLLLVIYR